MLLTDSDLAPIQQHYDDGLYLQAYAAAQQIGPLKDWRGAHGRLLAGRLAGNLGSARLGYTLYWCAHREHPDHLRTHYFHALGHLRRFGPYPTLKLMLPKGERCGEDENEQGEWLSLRAYIYAQLRDFESAGRDIKAAQQLAPTRRWITVQHSSILEMEDRYEEALDAAQQCRETHPWYRPAVQAEAQLLELNGRPEEAIDLLRDACGRLESGDLYIHLAGLLRDRQELEAAQQTYEKAAEHYPLLDQVRGDSWLNKVRSDIACQLGDHAAGLDFLQRIDDRHKSEFHKKVQARLEANGAQGSRRQLDVPFVRQHHMTCAPATLTMLARHFGREAEHLEIADAICYDGTPYHAERTWTHEQGYTVREFTVTPEVAAELIDRDIPFAFSTVAPTSAHLQAVIGYDNACGVLHLRDPFYPAIGQVRGASLEERYGPYGPRGMLMLPPDQAHRLDGIDLPDAEIWDLTHELRCALVEHQRQRGLKTLEQIEAKYPDHTLALAARLSLADYDGDTSARARLVNQLAQRYPKCPAMAYRQYTCLREQGRLDQAAELLDTFRAQKECHPVFLEAHARLLSSDAREDSRAGYLLQKALRRSPRTADNYYSFAGYLWSKQQQEEATELYRFAACLEDRREAYAIAFFRAQRVLGKETQTLELLHRRLTRHGTKSIGPAKTLFEAYRLLGRVHDGLDVLEQATELRPDDADLMIYRANELGEVGRYDEAMQCLENAKGRAHDADWHRCAAHLARDRGDNTQSLEHWLVVAKLGPLDVSAHRQVAGLKNRLEGPDAGLDYLKQCVGRFPHHIGLLHALYQEAKRRDLATSEQVLQQIIDKHPNDAWARRELAFNLLKQPDTLDQAAEQSDTAYAIDPQAVETLALRGRIARLHGRNEDAIAHYREAIERQVDYGYAIDELVDLAPDREARREALGFVLQQIQTQTVFGESIRTYATAARRALDDKQIEQDLRAILAGRETLWHAWAPLIDHLLRVGDLDTARDTAKQSVERFPLIPGLWNRLADIERVRNDRPAQIACLERAIAISPDNRFAARELAEVYEFDGQADKAVALLEQSRERDPHDTAAASQLVDLYWTTDARERAFSLAIKALEVDPYHDRLWNKLRYYAKALQREDEVRELVRGIPKDRPGEADAWLTVAYHLTGSEHLPDRLDAVDRCLALRPRLIEAYDLKAKLLCYAHRHEDAIAACNPPALAGDVPYNLRGRAAWVEAERGRLDDAIAQMQQLVEEHPNYTWGLEQICNWCGDKGDTRGLTQAANKLVELEPNNPMCLNYRAYAAITELDQGVGNKQRKAMLKARAKEDFERVAQLDPANGYCTVKLINLYVEDEEYDKAINTLNGAKGYLRDEEWLTKAAMIHAKRGAKDDCKQALAELCKVPTDNLRMLDTAFKHGRDMGVAAQVLQHAVNDPDTQPAVMSQYITEELDKRKWKPAIQKVNGLQDKPALWDRAASELMTYWANNKSHTKRLTRFVRDNQERIRRSEHTWGETAFALANNNKNHMVLEHFVGWRERSHLKPWMLTNLACAHLNLGQLSEAEQITRHSLTLPPDHAYAMHLVNLAHCEALQGDPAQAHQLLDQAVVEHEPTAIQFEHDLARAAATARTPGNNHLKKAWKLLAQARKRYPAYKHEPSSRDSYKRVVAAVGKASGPIGKAHAWLHRHLQ
ncbi:MAG: tetratricopeptide repeat protein [Phycisphaerales bacterium JB063]